MEHPHERFPVSGRLRDVAAFGIGFFEERVAFLHECLLIFCGAGGGHVGVVGCKRVQIESVGGELSVGIAQVADDRRMVPDFPDGFDRLVVGIRLFNRSHDEESELVAHLVERRIVPALDRVQIDGVESQLPEIFHPARIIDLGRALRKRGPEPDDAPVQQKMSVFRFKRAESERLCLFLHESSIRFFRPDPCGAEARMLNGPLRKRTALSGEENSTFVSGLFFRAEQTLSFRREKFQNEFSPAERGSGDLNLEFPVDAVGFPDPDVVDDRGVVRNLQIQVAWNSIRSFEGGAMRLLPEEVQIDPVFLAVLQKVREINRLRHQGSGPSTFPVDADHDLLFHMIERETDMFSFPFRRNHKGPFVPEKGVFCLVGNKTVAARLESIFLLRMDAVNRGVPADGHRQRRVKPLPRIGGGGFVSGALHRPESVQIDPLRGGCFGTGQKGVVPDAPAVGVIDFRPRQIGSDGAELEDRQGFASFVFQKRLAVSEDGCGGTRAFRIRAQRSSACAVIQIDAVGDQRSALRFSREQFPRNGGFQNVARDRFPVHRDILFPNFV